MKSFLRSAFICVVALSGSVFADQIASQSFKGINSNENPLIIGPEYAQDAQNVDVTPGGKSVKKRPGYGVYKTLSTSKNIHGIYHFYDSTGNDVVVAGSSTSLYGIVADGTPTQLLSSATLSSSWDCADIQGSAYCVDSNRDALIKTAGATINWYTTPLGTMVESTPDRLAIAGVSGNLSTIYLSGSNAFTTFTVGPLTTDPFTEVIAAPGSKITHLRWGCQKLLWWKDQSFGYFDFDDQFSASVKIVSDNVGTFDNTSAIDPGGTVWFRGQDGHIYSYDCSGLTKESIEITPFVQASGRRTSDFWTQTTQADFNGGAVSPVLSLSTAVVVDAVTTSSFNVTEAGSASGWSSGSTSNATVGTSSISISINNTGTVTNPSFESALAGNWTETGGGSTLYSKQSSFGVGCTVTPQSGSSFLLCTNGPSSPVAKMEVIDLNSTVLASVSIPAPANCAWSQVTLNDSADAGKRVKFRLKTVTSTFTEYLTTSDSYIFSGSVSIYGTTDTTGDIYFDNIQGGSSTVTSGSFASQAFNIGSPYGFVYASATWTVNTSTPSFVLQKSANGTTGWTDVSASTGVNVQSNQRYLRYLSTFTINGTDNALSSLNGVQIITQSSGTFYSAWKNAANLSAWSTFNPSYSDNGGANNFSVRSSTSPQSVLNSTVPWVSQTAGSLVSASTGTYFQVIDSFTITAATNTAPVLNDFTVNWFDGSATDQAYMLYFDNAIYASVAYGVGVSSNTYIFKRDLINDGWTVYNFGAGGLLSESNHLLFGDVADTGRLFEYGSGTSDNGSSITAYWRTKLYGGQDPFLENNFTNLDSYWGRNANQTGTVSYTLNGSTTATSYSVSLSSTTQSIIRSKKALPTGTNGTTIDLKFGDTSSSSQWELFLYRLIYTVYPYRPS